MTLVHELNQTARNDETPLEEALEREEAAVETLIKQATKYLTALKAWKKAAQQGNVTNRAKQADLACSLAPQLVSATTEAAAGWAFDATQWLGSEAWIREIEEACNRISVRTLREGEALICPPVVVRAQPSRGAVKIGKDVDPCIRPAVVASTLKTIRDRKSASGSAEFLECLYGVWKHMRTKDTPVARFRDIYAQYSMTPGWKKENPEQAFGQSLYALQRSGLTMTKKGILYQMEWPSGNAKDKDLFTVYAEDGKPIRYYGIRFVETEE